MGIDAIKRWHWILIGLLVGLGLGWSQTDQDSTTGEGRLISQPDFEREIVAKHPKTGEPLIKDIVLQPVTDDFHTPPWKVQPVTFMRLQQGAKTGKTVYMPAQFIAMVPYKPEGWYPQQPNLAAYLTEVGKRNKDLHFRYGWYNERPKAIALWMVGSVVLVGGIWPTILGLFTGVGIGLGAKKDKEEDYFARFSRAPDPAMTAKAAKVVSDSERQRLDDMNTVLEHDLKGAIDDRGTVNIPAEQKTAADVRKLEGGPLEIAQIAKPADDDEVEIKGEYYPVMIHHKKHRDEQEEQPPKK